MIRMLLVAVVVAAGIGWWWWATSPEYSLKEARGAIKAHDVVKFEKFVDVESVASGMVDSFLSGPVREMSSLGVVGRIITIGLVGLVKPGLVDSMKREILDLVEKGPPEPATRNSSTPESSSNHEDTVEGASESSEPGGGISLKRSLKTFGFKGKVYNGTEYTRRDAKIANVGLKLYNQKYNRDVVLDVKLRDMGGYWQIIGLPNLTQVLQTLIKLELDYHSGEKMEKTHLMMPLWGPDAAGEIRTLA